MTGLFGIVLEVPKERHDFHMQQCLLASQLVMDDGLNVNLTGKEMRDLTALADRRSIACLKE